MLFGLCDICRPKGHIERLSIPKWTLKNGSVVSASTRADIQDVLIEAVRDMRTYFAFNILDDLWEVQFSKDIFPKVSVFVNARDGQEAFKIAKQKIMSDLHTICLV